MKKITTDEYKVRLSQNSPQLELIGGYTNNKEKVLLKCKKCGCVFKRSASSDAKFSCEECGNIKKKKTNEQFLKELNEKHPKLTSLTEYNGDSNYVKLKCLECGYEWDCLPTNILRKKGCPRCQHKAKDKKYPKRLIRIRNLMIQRCINKNILGYKDYGGRGINVCEEWMNKPWTFYEWALKNGYEKNLTIDRIDNNKGYYPENCRWVNDVVQANNKRNTKKYEYNNEYKTIREWSEILKVDYKKLRNRVCGSKFSIKEAIEVPPHQKRSVFYK